MSFLSHRSTLWRHATVGVVAVLLTVAPLARSVVAQDPVATIAIASIEENFNDVSYVAELVGQGQQAKNMKLIVATFLAGIERKKPIGAMVHMGPAGPKAVVCLPVKSLDIVLETHRETIGEPKDAADGCKEITINGQSFYFKESAGYVFLSNDTESLTELPADPAASLGELASDFNLAIEVDVAAIPEELKKVAVDQLNDGLMDGLEQAGGSPEEREIQAAAAKQSIAQLEKMINETESLMVGIVVAQQDKEARIDFEMVAKPGTELAKTFNAQQDGVSAFAGFNTDPKAAVTVHGHSTLAKTDVDQALAQLKAVKDRAENEIDDDGALDAKRRTEFKAILGEAFELIGEGLKSGKVDLGAAIQLEPREVSFAAGISAPDGAKVEKLAKRFVDAAASEPDLPKLKLNAGEHAGVKLHTIDVPLPEDNQEAGEIIGNPVHVVIGTAPKAVYVAFGRQGEALLKRCVTNSATKANEKFHPTEIKVYLRPMVDFVASMSPNQPQFQAFARALANTEGDDDVTIESTHIEDGQATSIVISEELLKTLTQAAAAAR